VQEGGVGRGAAGEGLWILDRDISMLSRLVSSRSIAIVPPQSQKVACTIQLS
jgi:hypothetical protein